MVQKNSILILMQFVNYIINLGHGFKATQKLLNFRVLINTLNLSNFLSALKSCPDLMMSLQNCNLISMSPNNCNSYPDAIFKRHH